MFLDCGGKGLCGEWSELVQEEETDLKHLSAMDKQQKFDKS